MKKLNTKILIIVLVVLAAIFALSRVFRQPGLESNLRKTLVSVDTTKVTEVRIQPSSNRTSEIKLFKEGKNWNVVADKQKSVTDLASVKSMLGQLLDLRTQRLASRKKEKWETYNVGDKGTHVTIYEGSKKVADLNIGKTGFVQNGNGRFGGAYTYVRLSDENEVYTVDGFLESQFNRSYNDWRNKAFLRLNRDDITKLTFKYPADSGFVVTKKDSVWYVGNEKADLNKTQNFLGQLAFKNLNDFADGFAEPGSAPFTLLIEGKNGMLASAEGWRDGDKWTMKSTEQSGVYFSATNSIVKDFWVGKKSFLSPKSKK
jgi:hypothetical protein